MDGAGIHPPVPGVDAAVFPVQGGQDRPADFGDHQHAVGGDGAHHQPQRVDVGAQADRFPALPPTHGEDHVALVGAPHRIAQLFRDLFHHRGGLLRKAAGAVGGEQAAGGVHEKLPAVFQMHLH